MGYYDPYPQVSLERPLCLIGAAGSEAHSVGYWISSMTGLSYIEIDKLIEHEMGKGLAHLRIDGEVEEQRRLERTFIKRALRESPPRLISLGESALLDAETRSERAKRADLVYIRRPRPFLFDAISRGRVESPNRFPHWVSRAPQDLAELEVFLKPRESTYETAEMLIDAGELPALEVARRLMKRLNW